MAIDIEELLEVRLKNEDDFLKVKETLTRIGVASEKTKLFISHVIFYINVVSTILFILKNFLL
jgi:hypothetical protein